MLNIPNDINAENAVLGGILLDGSIFRDVSHCLKPDMFYSSLNKVIWAAMTELYKEGKPVNDWVLLSEKLKIHKMDIPMLMEKLDVPTAANIHHHVDIVRQYHWFRLLIEKSKDIQMTVSNNSKDLLGVLRSATEMFKEFSAASNTISLSLKKIVQEAAERVATKSDMIPWGLQRIDRQMGGLIKRQPTVVAGRTSNLKTTFVTSPIPFWLDSGLKVQVFSLEVAADQYLRKLVCKKGKVDSRAVSTHSLTKPQLEQYIQVCTQIYDEYEGKFSVLDFTHGIKNIDLLERAARAFKPDILIVDYIGLLPTSKQYKRIEVEEHMIFLKELAIDLNCAPIIVAQINRAPMKKLDGPPFPRLEDLKESGGIEENACHVYLLYYYYSISGEKKDMHRLMVNLAKNKYGPLGKWHLLFNPIHCDIRDLGIERFDASGKENPIQRASTL